MYNHRCFMNKIDIHVTPEVKLELESFGYVRLGRLWDHILLGGDHWRFYHHDAPGAFVRLNDRWVEFLPDRSYLLAPCCNLMTRCPGNPVQMFLHFVVPWLDGTPEKLLYALPEDFCREEVAALRRLLETRSDHTAIRLHSLALCSRALCALPPEALTRRALDSRVRAVRNYINLNLNEDMSLETMARLARLSENTFLRLFRRECGMTPYQYLLQQRYHYAARLLRDAGRSIDEICEMTGIHDRFHFSRRFKTIFGMAPAAYRKHCRAGACLPRA